MYETGNGILRRWRGSYITKRFDYASDGLKIPQEDFSSLAGKTEGSHGKDFKYTGSYEDAAMLIRKNVVAWKVEMSNFFVLVVFNYLFSNGDAEAYRRTGHPCKDDFMVLGRRIGVLPKKMNAIVEMFATEHQMIYELIEHSFLDERAKRMYRRSYQERLHRFQKD